MDKNRGILLFVVAFFSAVSAYAMTRGIMSVPILLDRSKIHHQYCMSRGICFYDAELKR